MEKRLGPFPSTPDGAPAPTLGERSGAPSGLRPSSFVICNTPVEVQFTSAGCLNYPCRTPQRRTQLHFTPRCGGRTVGLSACFSPTSNGRTRYRADPNLADKTGQTPLSFARKELARIVDLMTIR